MTKSEVKIWNSLVLGVLLIILVMFYDFNPQKVPPIHTFNDFILQTGEYKWAEWMPGEKIALSGGTTLTPLQFQGLIRAMEDTEISYTELSDPPPTDGILHLLLRGNTGEPFHFVLLPDGRSGYTIGSSPYFLQFKEEENAFLVFFKTLGAII